MCTQHTEHILLSPLLHACDGCSGDITFQTVKRSDTQQMYSPVVSSLSVDTPTSYGRVKNGNIVCMVPCLYERAINVCIYKSCDQMCIPAG